MKFLALIFLFGLATASFHDILDNSDEEDFILKSELKIQRTDKKITEFVEKLRVALRNVLREIKKAIEEGRHVSKELLDKAKDLFLRLKERGVEIGDEIKDLWDYLKTRIPKWVQELLDAFRDKRSLLDRMKDKIPIDIIKKLKDMVTRGESGSNIIETIKKLLPSSKLKERLIDLVKQGVDKFKAVLEKILPKRETRSIIDNIKKHIEELGIKKNIEKLVEMIRGKVEESELIEFIKERIPNDIFKMRDLLLNTLKKGTDKLKDMCDLFLK